MGSIAHVSPPLRSASDCEALWRGVRDGTVQMVVSDDAPHEADQVDRPDLWNPAVTGFTGVELIAPLLLTAVSRGRLSLESFATVMCKRPAQLFGLYPTKGSLIPGADADFTLCDLSLEIAVHPEEFRSRGRLTPFSAGD